MASIVKQYTKEVMAVACSTCGAEPLNRCKRTSGIPLVMRPCPPHAARLRSAYYRSGCYMCQMGDPHEVHQTNEEFWSGENMSSK